MTTNSVIGIVNFVLEDRYDFGQGVITYANERSNNTIHWLLTLIDSFRVAEDYGKLRFQFINYHRPYFGIKGNSLLLKPLNSKFF